MLGELKILIENIKHLRQLLTEGVSDNAIIDAIENHEYLYIYYAGDDTIEKGYRTVRPFVLGTTTKGNLALRAWQDKGKSDSLRPDSPRKRYNHEYFTDTDGAQKAGWRLFLVDNITSAYPTGKKFNDAQGRVMIPPLYNENDKQMTGIIAKISAKPEKAIQSKDTGRTSVFKTQTTKWQSFFKANKENRDITANDVQKLYDIAKKVMKKSPNSFFVAINDRNEFVLKDVRDKTNFPPNAIVGDLTSLYSKLVKTNAPVRPEGDKFFTQGKDKLGKENVNNAVERKTFFKQ